MTGGQVIEVANFTVFTVLAHSELGMCQTNVCHHDLHQTHHTYTF
jgi:hypothetical protein